MELKVQTDRTVAESAARLVADRVTQGLPEQVEDPAVLALIASLIRDGPAAPTEDPQLR